MQIGGDIFKNLKLGVPYFSVPMCSQATNQTFSLCMSPLHL